MAVYSSKDVAWILIGGYNLVGDSTEITDKVEALTDDLMSLSDSWPEPAAVGLSRAEITQRGFFNDAAGALNEALVTPGISRVLCYGVEGNTLGKKFIGYTGAMQIDYERIASLAQLHRADASYRGNGQVDTNGIILHTLKAEMATGNTEGADSQDHGASTAIGGAGYFQVTAISGTGATIDAKVRHSADDITYADLITFAQVVLADARKAERKTVTGTVNRHLATSWTIAGTAPSVTFMVGFARG